MLLKVIRQMKEDPDLQEAFLHDPEQALAKQGVSEEERSLLLGGDQERIGRTLAREAAQADEVDLEACSVEVKQILACGDEEQIAQYFSKLPKGPKEFISTLMPSPAPGPWIYNDEGMSAARRITGIAPNNGRRGSTVKIICAGSYFEPTYAGAELKHATSGHAIAAASAVVTRANHPQSTGELTFVLSATIPVGTYKLFVRRRSDEPLIQASNIGFEVKA